MNFPLIAMLYSVCFLNEEICDKISTHRNSQKMNSLPRGHKDKMSSLLIQVSLFYREYLVQKWDLDQKWACQRFMALGP